MHNPVSSSHGMQRVDVALLVGEAGYRMGVLHFPLADGDPGTEAFETFGTYASVGGRGLGIASRLDTHAVTVRLSPPDAGSQEVLNTFLPDAAAARAAWTRIFTPGGTERTSEPETSGDGVSAEGLRYVLTMSTDDNSARLEVQVLAGDTVWFSTAVRSTRDAEGWTTAHRWTPHDPGA